jgi:protein AroM
MPNFRINNGTETNEGRVMIVGCVTIGHSPRDIESIERYAPSNVQFIQSGALDGLSKADIAELSPLADEDFYISKMKDGSITKVSSRRIKVPLQSRINQLIGSGAHLIIILCSGAFPDVQASVPVVRPDLLLSGVVSSMIGNGRLGLVAPESEQLPMIRRKWASVTNVELHAINPYSGVPEDFVNIGKELAHCEIVVLDGFFYTNQQAALVRQDGANGLVLTPQRLTAAILQATASD